MPRKLDLELVLLNGRENRQKELGAAIALYSKHTPPHLKTPTEEISYWSERYNHTFKNILMQYGLIADNKVIGFCEITIFPRKRFIMADQIVVHPHQRNITIFSAFIDLIKEDLDKRGYEYDFAAVEIPLAHGSNEPYPSERLMMRLLKFHGFGVVKQPYEMPNLDPASSEAEGPAHLMLYVKGGTSAIASTTYIKILETIFYEHYLDWYRMPQHEKIFDTYKASVDKLFTKLKTNAQSYDSILLNGWSSMNGSLPKQTKEEVDWLVKFTIPAGATVLILTIGVVIVASIFEIMLVDLSVIVSLAALITLLFQALRTTRAERLFKIFVNRLNIFGRR